ncbi:MAG: hypothetical protein WAO28_00310 [Candidatus Microsaccharimonas sp.]
MTSFGGVIKAIIRRNSVAARTRGRAIRTFANKLGLVYFGTVDQKTDDHKVIRGLTVSTTHRDNHYAVGSFNDYDVSIVDRFDIIINPRGIETDHNWLIFQINLENGESFPHTFFNPIGHDVDAYSKFFTSFSHLGIANPIFEGNHSDEFSARYQIFATAGRALEIEKTFNADVTKTIAARLWPHAIEILDNKLYIYTLEPKLTETLLETAISSGLWLAQLIDARDDSTTQD